MDSTLKKIASLCLVISLPSLILLFGVFHPAQADPPDIYRVAKTGDGSDGSTWGKAFTDPATGELIRQVT